jgi:hypothetical protein
MADLGAFQAGGRFGKAVPLRLRTGTDMMTGLRQVCEANGIKVTGANPILATLDGMIAEVTDVKLVRRMDADVGMGLFTPEPA